MTRRVILLLVALGLAVASIAAYIPAKRFTAGLFTYWRFTDTTNSVNVDTANGLMRGYIIRLADSAAANRAGTVREEFQFTGTANTGNANGDSANLQLYGNVYHIHPMLFNQYLDRVSLHTSKPATAGPSTWRDDLPPVSPDSCLIFRISRNNAFAGGSQIGLTAYKVAAGAGLSFNNTTGVFYDMLRFNENTFIATGSGNTQVHLQISTKKRR